MNTTAKYALGVAAAALVAIVGFTLVNGGNVGGRGLGDLTPSSTASPIPTASPEPQALLTGSRGPGTFTTEFGSEAAATSPVAFTFELPADWAAVRPWVIAPTTEGDGGAVVFVQVSGLYSDPCLANSGAPDVAIGSTADELASALAAHPAYEATATGTFTIDGYNGVRMDLVTPSDLDYSTCQEGNFWLWDGPLYAGAPSQFDLWIFDLDGTTAVVLAELTDVPAQGRSQIEQIVESINIQP